MTKRSAAASTARPHSLESPLNPKVKAYRLVGDEETGATKGMLDIIELAPGASLPLHKHDGCEQVTFVLSGSGVHTGGAEPVRLGEHEAVFLSPGEWHGFHNDGEQPCTLIVLYGGAANTREAGYELYEEGKSEPSQFALRKLCAQTRFNTSPEGGMPREYGVRRSGGCTYVTAERVGAKSLMVAITYFAAGGGHLGLHRHPRGEEFFYVLEGGGTHMTREGEFRLETGEMVATPILEEHGWRNDADRPSQVLFGFFGASSLERVGYEQTVKPPDM